ncbi:MAG: hypothetical protein CMF39_01425 [Legionellaceae bacterium]|mgnify:CR=1 FL=1|nr:hypothetical protein [Legionellaceae bacterium]|tara:strand:+ start:721 stop:1179 length:459 start_codon:yes stop_codon:yes gene_type:complete
MQTNVYNVARYFIEKANDAKAIVPLTPMKLNKLCYIAQGFSLASRDKPLFPEEIQAWKYGPIIPELYQAYKAFGKNHIDQPLEKFETLSDDDDKAVVDYVWNKMKNWTAMELSGWTHRLGSAWSKLFQEDMLNVEIPVSFIKQEFKQLESVA